MSNKSKRKPLQPWFDTECKTARKAYRKRKRTYRNNKTDETFTHLKDAERNYKRKMNSSMRNYREKMKNEIKNLKTNNPKEY